MIMENKKDKRKQGYAELLEKDYIVERTDIKEREKHIPKDRIRDYIGKTVWYDVRVVSPIPIYPVTIVSIKDKPDEKHLKEEPVIYYERNGFDFVSSYENFFVFWENMPDEETRMADDWRTNSSKS